MVFSSEELFVDCWRGISYSRENRRCKMAQTDMRAVIAKDIQDLSPDTLEEVHNYIVKLKEQGLGLGEQKADLMAFAGSWAEMSGEEYKTLMEDINQHRQQAFSERPRDEIGLD
jgi:hypothetical protein